MIALCDFLAIERDSLVAAWADQTMPAEGAGMPRDQWHDATERVYDGLVHLLYDGSLATQRQYVQDVIKPRLRAGLGVADLRGGMAVLDRLISAEIDRQVADPADRAQLHTQWARDMESLGALWDMAARQVAEEVRVPTAAPTPPEAPPPSFPTYFPPNYHCQTW